ncbi:2-dehydro-3-deoxygluconokinase [Nakamurella panacisegetis]|uniref:2-dehydro-3-deoxygluconokinase n=1 Tax=Nakamurella panacisegetis TaxID=1090615 RepID=A0A1H0ISE3_9ACTN|nr:sugar kinase [Nakamurella panacisegetis]SDO34285.1 2-dehydro-3-deoxygluconokinase [Nakamurella panacisegetis]
MFSTLLSPGRTPGSVVTLGETMALLTTPTGGRLRSGAGVPVGIGGAESNVAIGLARLGVRSTWISRVGDDAFGALVTREIRGEGVHVAAHLDAEAPTGMMVKELRDGRPWRVRYYRSNSAASRLGPDDIDPRAISDADVLHLTGITPALGSEPLRAVEYAIEIARRSGTLVSLDINFRATLWSAEQAAPVLARIAGAADIVFAGPEEAALLLGWPPPTGGSTVEHGEELARGLIGLGPETAVVKLGALGAVGVTAEGAHYAPARSIAVVDAVGAGDAFVAGYLSELVAGASLLDCLRMGNVLGGAVCQQPGDWEGLPTRAELTHPLPAGDVVR